MPSLALLWISLSPTLLQEGAPVAKNVALGAKYSLHPAPNYVHCTDPDDSVQLTDGKSTTAYFWTQKGTVGWRSAGYATVTVDLGQVQPISGVGLTTAAGVAGVTWPAAIRVLVSDDGAAYRDAGDLVALDLEAHGTWPEGYAIRRLSTTALATRGRFIRFVIIPSAGGPYIFVDEVEVFHGPPGLLGKEPVGPVVRDTEDLFRRWRTSSSIRHRFAADSAALIAAIREAKLSEEARERLLGQAADTGDAFDPGAITVDRSFRAILPFNVAHARLFELQAELWRELGYPALSATAAAPWDPLDLFALPTRSSADAFGNTVEVHAMIGEYRAGAIVVANATERAQEFRLRFEGLPGAPAPSYVTVHEVAWTDTGRGRPVAAALPGARRAGDAWKISVLPGLLRQVWFTFRPLHLDAGLHAGKIVIEGGPGDPVEVGIRLRVFPFRFPERTSLWLGGWSYTNGGGRYGITAANRGTLVEHLQSHFVNAPWATSSVMMRFRFKEDPSEEIELDTREFDAWIAQWPHARAYLVFLAVAHHSGAIKTSLGKAGVGTAAFHRRVGIWISAWVDHLRKKGISPDRLGLLIHDEPHEGSAVGPLVDWARAIRAAQPEIIIWEDPTYRNPAAAPRELFEVADVLCPNRPMWLSAGEPFRQFYLEQRRERKTLHFYSCSGPARLLDPYAYYRLQAWECFRQGATGSFFWAFGDNGGTSSWNEYLVRAGPYTPLFLDDAGVTAGKQMEAIRESVEDYETLCMLRRALEKARAAGREGAALTAAESALERAAPAVLDAPGARKLFWHDPKDRGIADAVRLQVLEALQALGV